MIWDDDVNIINNVFVTQGLTAESVKGIFTTDIIGGYNPLTTLSFAAEHHFFGLNPRVTHTNNVLLHLGCVFFVFWLLLQMGLKRNTAFFIALLFGIHPMRAESVAWATERKDVLFAIFYFASLVSYTYFIKSGNKKYFWYIIPLFVLSLLSKIQAVSLPLSMLALDYWFKRDLKFNLVIEKIPFFLLSLAVGLLGIIVLKDAGTLDTATTDLGIPGRAALAGYSLVIYLIKAVVPYEMVCLYPYPGKLEWYHYISVPLVLALGFGLYLLRDKKPYVIFGAAFFLFNVMFVLQFFGAGQGFLADRFTYVPYFGLFFILGYFLQEMLDKNAKMKNIIQGGALMYAALMALLCFNQNLVWRDSISLWNHALSKYETSTGYNNRGREYRERNELDKALADYDKALSINPEGATVYNNRGKIYFDRQDFARALNDYEKAIQYDDTDPEILSNYGGALAGQSRYEEALTYLNKAAELDPTHLETYINRMVTNQALQRYEDGIKDCDAYLKYKANPDILSQRGLFNRFLGRNEAALPDFNRAIELNDQNATYFYNRSRLYYDTGNMPQALSDAQAAARLGYQLPAGYLEAMQ